LINLRLNKSITKSKIPSISYFLLTYGLIIALWCLPISCFSEDDDNQGFENYIFQAELADGAFQFEAAALNYQKAIQYCDSLNNWTCILETSNQLIKLLIKTAAYDKAGNLLEKNMENTEKRLSKKSASKSAIETEIEYLKALFQFKQGYFKKARTILNKHTHLTSINNYSDSLNLAKIFELKGWIETELSMYTEAFEHFNEAYSMHPKKNMKLALANYHFNIGVYFFKINDYNNAENNLIKSLRRRKTALSPMHPLIADCAYWLGKVYTKKEAFKRADSLLQISLDNRNNLYQNNLHPSIAESYEGLAQMHRQQANFTKAIEYYQLSLERLKKIYPKKHPFQGKLHNNLAIVQQSTNEYQDAYKNYTKALRIFEQSYGIAHPYYLECLNNMGILHIDIGNVNAALEKFKEAINIIEEEEGFVNVTLLDRLYYNMAILYFHLDDYTKMNYYLNKMSNISLDQYIELSKIHYENKNYTDALNFLIEIEDPDEIKNFSTQVDLYYLTAQSNYALFQTNKEQLYLVEAQIAIQNCDTLIQQRRREVGELLRFNEMIRPAYELGLQIFDAGYQSTKDSTYINYAFQFIHTSKAHVLLNRLNENRAIHLGLSADLIEKEHSYRKEINRLRKEENQTDTLNTDSIRTLLRITQQAYKTFKNHLEQQYPQYYQLKYDTSTTSIAQVQTHLNNESSVIEYFLSDKSLYILQIEKDDKRFFKIPKPDNLSANIEALRETINWGVSDTIAPDKIYQTFISQAFLLYQQVIEKPLMAIHSKNIQHLIIIPDNQLNYLPFDLLLTNSLNRDEINYTTLPYVLKKYATSYAYSSSFLTGAYPQINSRGRLNYIGYAPNYDSTARQMVKSLQQQNNSSISLRSGYANLPYAIKAVEKIDSLLGGESYTDEEASKQKFIDNINRAKIQHLAMHGEVDDENPHNSKLIFGDEDLTMDDLNTLQINADLVVLTACKTGDGQLKNGEGVISLSRAFAYAGCPSVIMSLWSLPDEQTAYLSELFFLNLKNGMHKHKALQQAKLSYLQNPTDDITIQPFFWGGLVATGNMEPIFKPTPKKPLNSWYLLLLIFPLLLVIPKLLKTKKA